MMIASTLTSACRMQGGSGLLNEFGSKAMGAEVKCLDVPPVPTGRVGAPFLALGFFDSTIRILSLGAEDTLEVGGLCLHGG